MLNPTSPGGASGYQKREYLGGVSIPSGTWNKSDIAGYAFLAGEDLKTLEYEFECVGGGGAGGASNYGGNPGSVSMRSLAYADIPDTLMVSVGAGASASAGTSGGNSSIAGLLYATGGQTAVSRIYLPHHAQIGPVPGAGGYNSPADSSLNISTQYYRNGTDGFFENPDLATAGGDSGFSGADAVDLRSYGSGGGRGTQCHGGTPGGGGGVSSDAIAGNAGNGGDGAVRLRIYKLSAG